MLPTGKDRICADLAAAAGKVLGVPGVDSGVWTTGDRLSSLASAEERADLARMSTAADDGAGMQPPLAADISGGAPGESKVKEAEKKIKRKKKKRSSSGKGASSTIASTGDHVDANNGRAKASPPQHHPPAEENQLKGTSVIGAAAGGDSGALAGAARVRRNSSEDAVGRPQTVGGVDEPRGGKGALDKVDGDGAGITGGDDDGDQDEGVVIQRGAAPKLAQNGEATKKEAKKKSKREDRAMASPSLSAAEADVRKGDGGAAELTPTTEDNKKKNKKRRNTSQEADGSDEAASGIPFALPSQGAVVSNYASCTFCTDRQPGRVLVSTICISGCGSRVFLAVCSLARARIPRDDSAGRSTVHQDWSSVRLMLRYLESESRGIFRALGYASLDVGCQLWS